MPAEPVPLIGSVNAFSVRNTARRRSRDLVEHDEEVGVEVAEHRPLERFHHLGIRVRRTRPEQQSIGVHGAIEARSAPQTTARAISPRW